MTNNAYIGIDLGTSGCRAIAIDQQNNIIAQSQQPLISPSSASNNFQQDPHEHWSVVVQVLAELIPLCSDYHIQAISVDATSGSILVTDSEGHALSPILMYNHNKAIEQSQLIKQCAPENSAAHGVSSGLAKILYLQQLNPLPANVQYLHQTDWINFKLGAALGITDENNALKSGYDPIQCCWPDWINQLTPLSQFPSVVTPGTLIGSLSAELCQQLGLSSDNPPQIMAGTTDSVAGLIATGACESGDAVSSLGSTLVVKLISDSPIFSAEQGIYSHRLGDKWLVGGASNTGGAVLKHYFSDDELQRLTSSIPLDTPVEDYYPLLTAGERFPINDPHLAAKLTPRPESDALFLYGMLQGMARIEKQAYHLLEQVGASHLNSIRTVGGGAVNTVWQTCRQQQIPVPFVPVTQTQAAYGAALLAKGIL